MKKVITMVLHNVYQMNTVYQLKVCGYFLTTFLRYSGHNMSIISIVDKIRSLSIEFNTNQSTNIGNR